MPFGCAIMHLGDPGRIGVVDQQNVATELTFEDLLGLGVDPRLVDVGSRSGLAVGHHSRDGDAERTVTNDVGERVDDFRVDRRHVLGCRPLRRGDAKSLRREFASSEIVGRSFDAAAADVDAEYGRATYRFFAHAGEPSDIGPLWGEADFVSPLLKSVRATELAETPRIERGVDLVRVGEVEAVEAAIHIYPADNVTPVSFHGDRLQPGRICGRVSIRLELEEDQRPSDIHQGVSVHGVRAEVRDSGDNRPLRALAEVRVGRTDVTVNQRWCDGPLREVTVQLVPNLGYVGNVAFQLISAALRRPSEHVCEKLSKRVELPWRLLANEACESRHSSWQVLHSFGGIKKADERWAALGHIGMLQPT